MGFVVSKLLSSEMDKSTQTMLVEAPTNTIENTALSAKILSNVKEQLRNMEDVLQDVQVGIATINTAMENIKPIFQPKFEFQPSNATETIMEIQTQVCLTLVKIENLKCGIELLEKQVAHMKREIYGMVLLSD